MDIFRFIIQEIPMTVIYTRTGTPKSGKQAEALAYFRARAAAIEKNYGIKPEVKVRVGGPVGQVIMAAVLKIWLNSKPPSVKLSLIRKLEKSLQHPPMSLHRVMMLCGWKSKLVAGEQSLFCSLSIC